MRHLAKTLLILGGMTACERAQPLVDHRARPAVGNIGQTGKPETQLPAVAIEPERVEPVPMTLPTPKLPTPRHARVMRAMVRPLAIQQQQPITVVNGRSMSLQQEQVVKPLRNEEERPAVGNVMMGKAGPHRAGDDKILSDEEYQAAIEAGQVK